MTGEAKTSPTPGGPENNIGKRLDLMFWVSLIFAAFFALLGLFFMWQSCQLLLEGRIAKGMLPAIPKTVETEKLVKSAAPTMTEALGDRKSPVMNAVKPKTQSTSDEGYWSKGLDHAENVEWADSASACAGIGSGFLTVATLIFMWVQMHQQAKQSLEFAERARDEAKRGERSAIIRSKEQKAHLDFLEKDAKDRSEDQAEHIKVLREAAERQAKDNTEHINLLQADADNQKKESIRRSNESSEHLKLASEVMRLNALQARVPALSAKLESARARLETLIKGSALDSKNQDFGTDKEAYDLIKRHLISESPQPAQEIIGSAVEQWKEANVALDLALTELLVAVRTFDKGPALNDLPEAGETLGKASEERTS